MTSGYPTFNPFGCTAEMTVAQCFVAGGAVFDESTLGKFHYGGAHDQNLAVELGLGELDRDGLIAEVRAWLGEDLELAYLTPQPAGGMTGSAAQYAAFLRKLLAGDLVLRDLLGVDPVCARAGTPSSATECPDSWHYGYNHWIEDDPSSDGAFSSPGAFGFYPWISADKSVYGIVSRMTVDVRSADESARCGQRIRRAWHDPETVEAGAAAAD
jgi:hypothetical protein